MGQLHPTQFGVGEYLLATFHVYSLTEKSSEQLFQSRFLLLLLPHHDGGCFPCAPLDTWLDHRLVNINPRSRAESKDVIRE